MCYSDEQATRSIGRKGQRLAVGRAALFGGLALAALSVAPAARAADEWQFTLTPYVWLPDVSADMRFALPPGQGSSANVNVGPSNLEGAFLISGEMRKGDLALFADLIYLDYQIDSEITRVNGGRDGPVLVPRSLDAGTEVGLEGGLAQLAVSYTVAKSDAGSVDVFGGLRYMTVDGRLDWSLQGTVGDGGFTLQRSGRVKDNTDALDGIVGLRGRWQFDEHWFAPYYVDVGSGDSDLTWQAMAGVGYGFGWGDITLAWRVLDYDRGDNELLQQLKMDGPAVSAAFRF